MADAASVLKGWGMGGMGGMGLWWTRLEGRDTDTVELPVKTLLSQLITQEFNSPADSLRAPDIRVDLYRLAAG